eukprot:1105091-Prymnesium_polylepis.1
MPHSRRSRTASLPSRRATRPTPAPRTSYARPRCRGRPPCPSAGPPCSDPVEHTPYAHTAGPGPPQRRYRESG